MIDKLNKKQNNLKISPIDITKSIFLTISYIALITSGLSYARNLKPNIGSSSQILYYDKPDSIFGSVALILLLGIPSFIAVCEILKSKYTKHIRRIGLLLFLVTSILIYTQSYFVITSDSIYYKTPFYSHTYSDEDVKYMNINCHSSKNVYSSELDVTFNDGRKIVLYNGDSTSNPNNFIPFDKSCINAKKTISKKLIEDHKNTFIKTYGVNSDYILDNYTESEQ